MALQISVQWKNQYWDIGRNKKKKKNYTNIALDVVWLHHCLIMGK